MSKKRTSPESSNDEQTNEDSDSVFQQDDNAKRAKLTLSSDSTLQDLPIELIERVLLKAVAMEVEGMKVAKSVWKAKADLVISRLRTVSSQWCNILTTDFFRNELHRTLDRTAQKTIRLEILHQFSLQFYVLGISTIKDEIFLLCLTRDSSAVHVYDRNNMAEVKDVIPLPEICPQSLAACSISNCVYILGSKALDLDLVLRITRDDQRLFNISPIISDQWMMTRPNLSVTANGSLILFRRIRSEQLPVISMYNANGSLQHEIRLSSELSSPDAIIPNSNGNLLMVSDNDQQQTKLTEIDMDGTILRRYQSSLTAFNGVCHADIYGRLLLSDQHNRFELLDSEFNLLDSNCSKLRHDMASKFLRGLHYNSQRNEVVTTVFRDLTIFHFTEE